MKYSYTVVLATSLILLSTCLVGARAVRIWSDGELLAKSELTVIATPTATQDTEEQGSHPNYATQPIIGVETKFAVTTVLKGAPATKSLALHHYRPGRITMPNAPGFLAFDAKKKRSFRLYLVREADGRYAPVAGQLDPNLSVREEVTPPTAGK